MSARLGLALAGGVAIAVAIASCGGGAAKQTRAVSEPRPPEPPQAEMVPWTAGPDATRARIETLAREIASREGALGLEPLAPGVEPPAPMSAQAAKTCVRSPRPVCQDVCSLSDSICSAADEICELADQLAGDAWAAGRCTAGKTSCARARERCCNC